MSTFRFLSFVGAVSLWLAAPKAEAADCVVPSDLVSQVEVVSTPLPVKTDFSEAELRAMSPGPHRHPPLGYYWDEVGYRLNVQIISAPNSCPKIAVLAQLVQARQEIQIARELASNPCLFQATERHYRRHADTTRAALSNVAAGLPSVLRATVSQVLATYGVDRRLKNRIEVGLSAKLDKTVAEFAGLGGALRDKVDSPAEVGRLQPACGAV